MKTIKSLRLALEAAVIALFVKAGLRFCSFATIYGGLERVGARYRPRWANDIGSDRVHRFGTRAVGILPGRDTCLVRSLTSRVLLRCYSHEAELRFGVKRTAEGFHGHAWLERPDGTTFVSPEGTEEFVKLRSER